MAEGTGRTIAVEPNPQVLKYLKATQAVNGAPFELVEMAVSDSRGIAVLTVTEHESGGGTIKPNELKPGKSQVSVPTITIDELMEEKGVTKVDVIKMDVESVEPLVFAGMKNTIRKNPQVQIIMEYTPSNYEDAKGFTNYLFSEFEIQHIRGYNELVKLDSTNIPFLLQRNEHIDLYLRPKVQTAK